ncbi:hypothetical protein [Alteribacter keqinensis]|uniref:Uncharacterized protein n=1 Tax=Alteribacter keqinensis TaxID=2483800 RepID=A0A3M7TXG3_9BACI|nr:hypothetical protein [Alteribacter keqinensis]RNA70183.1 hypothetical protein EBO34_09730 [Alteribacter keqinensis]
MIIHKGYFIASLSLFFVVMALNFPFPHATYQRGVHSAVVLGIPVSTTDGIMWLGWLYITMIAAAVVLLVKALDKYKLRLSLLSLLLVNALPIATASAYERTIASGVYAVSYESGESVCEFNRTGNEPMKVECELMFTNHSNEAVFFTLSFMERYSGYKEFNEVLSLLNENGPYEVSLRGSERKVVSISKEMNVSTTSSAGRFGGGSFNGPNLKIEGDDGKTRTY